MEWILDVALLVCAGLAAGYIAGLIGVGGGIIFTPVLFYYFAGTGIPPSLVTPLTLGSGLLCTLVAGGSSAWFHYREHAVLPRIAVPVGIASAFAILLITHFVTTQTWYNQQAFQIAFSIILIAVAVRMIVASIAGNPHSRESHNRHIRPSIPLLAATGGAAGSVAAAAGVGGGIVLVPMYNRFLKLGIRRAAGTSSATIILISLAGVLTYILMGLQSGTPGTALGYVDTRAFLLAAPSIITVRAGVWTSHRIDRKWLQWSFAVIALVVAVRMAWQALGG